MLLHSCGPLGPREPSWGLSSFGPCDVRNIALDAWQRYQENLGKPEGTAGPCRSGAPAARDVGTDAARPPSRPRSGCVSNTEVTQTPSKDALGTKSLEKQRLMPTYHSCLNNSAFPVIPSALDRRRRDRSRQRGRDSGGGGIRLSPPQTGADAGSCTTTEGSPGEQALCKFTYASGRWLGAGAALWTVPAPASHTTTGTCSAPPTCKNRHRRLLRNNVTGRPALTAQRAEQDLEIRAGGAQGQNAPKLLCRREGNLGAGVWTCGCASAGVPELSCPRLGAAASRRQRGRRKLGLWPGATRDVSRGQLARTPQEGGDTGEQPRGSPLAAAPWLRQEEEHAAVRGCASP